MRNAYAIFHANLNFSLIEESECNQVIIECYWPLLKLLKKNQKLKISLEFSGNTLLKISHLNPQFLNEIKSLAKQKKLEVIASGLEQIISPLVPYHITLDNLDFAKKVYQELLGSVPEIAFINEQTYSDGLIDLYNEAGFKAIVIDWDSLPQESKQVDPPYQTKTLESQKGTKIVGIFISSAANQKFRDLIFSQISQAQYFKFLNETIKRNSLPNFPIYGDDLEIYDFEPGSLNFTIGKSVSKHFRSIENLLVKLAEEFNFILPSFFLEKKINTTPIHLTDAALTIRTKKEEDYNVSRWAVCGRTNSRTNHLCYKLFRNIKTTEKLSQLSKKKGIGNSQLNVLKRELVNLWGSDFRTHTTESKWINFQKRLGWALKETEVILNQLIVKHKPKGNGFVLINPSGKDWDYQVFETDVTFKPHLAFGEIGIEINGSEIDCQQEEVNFYQDGSISTTKLIFKPKVLSFSKVSGNFIFKNSKKENYFVKINKLETKSVSIKFLTKRGATIESLTFPQISKNSLCGYIAKGYYQIPKLQVDWFTGHTIIRLKDDSQLTDLEDLEIFAPENLQDYPIRIPVYGKMNIGNGEVVKKYYVYTDELRIDIEKRFMFYNLEPKSFRNFNLTLIPDSFDINSMFLATVNGGKALEKFMLVSSKIMQDEAVSLKVSSSGCQGATTGWVAVGDKDKIISVITDLNKSYSPPLVHFDQTGKTFFGRISTTIAESDQTSYHFFRGKLGFKTSVCGAKDLNEIININNLINEPLIFIMNT